MERAGREESALMSFFNSGQILIFLVKKYIVCSMPFNKHFKDLLEQSHKKSNLSCNFRSQHDA